MADKIQIVETGARFSGDRKYRYSLWRTWDATKEWCCFILLNPSTADEIENDPTLERCQRRAKQWGYGSVEIVNIFAWRSTNPKALYKIDDPVGQMNDYFIRDAATRAALVVCGWGKHGALKARGSTVQDWFTIGKLKQAHALKINKDGSPQHPLYIGYAVKPIPY